MIVYTDTIILEDSFLDYSRAEIGTTKGNNKIKERYIYIYITIGNIVIFNSERYIKWNKSVRNIQIPYDFIISRI